MRLASRPQRSAWHQ